MQILLKTTNDNISPKRKLRFQVTQLNYFVSCSVRKSGFQNTSVEYSIECVAVGHSPCSWKLAVYPHAGLHRRSILGELGPNFTTVINFQQNHTLHRLTTRIQATASQLRWKYFPFGLNELNFWVPGSRPTTALIRSFHQHIKSPLS